MLCKDIANEHKERDFQFVECSYILCKDIANEHKERNFQFVECSYILCKDIANEHKERNFQFVECSYILCKDSLFPLLYNQYHQIIYQKQATKAIDLTARKQSIHTMKTITLHDENCHFMYSSHTLSKPNCMELHDKENKTASPTAWIYIIRKIRQRAQLHGFI